MKYELPQLPYAYNALEPVISEEIMILHHQKHHQTYINNLNAALEKHPEIADRPLEELLKNLKPHTTMIPEDIRDAVGNHGGGHYNHSLFWQWLRPPLEANKPTGLLFEKIEKTFGSFQQFQELFNKTAIGRFGSGWGWLSVNDKGDLTVHSTPNQDTPLAEGLTPILGIDVWEHAYYLQYKSDRAAYVQAWWQVVNWEGVENNLAGSL